MSKAKQDKYEVDPTDGLVREIIGDWSPEKHQRLKRYVDITYATRRKFARNKPAYIDLYCGPGRARVRNSETIVDGSALVAVRQADSNEPFGQVFVADAETEMADACNHRLRQVTSTEVQVLYGNADDTAKQVVSRLNRFGLHLAFLDPFSLGQLPFSVIQTLGQIKRMDLIIYFGWMDLQRNLDVMARDGRLDRVAPGWQSHVNINESAANARLNFFRYWRSLVEGLGYFVSDNIERVTGPKNQPLYLLVLASRDTLADRFWKQVSDVSPQGSLTLSI